MSAQPLLFASVSPVPMPTSGYFPNSYSTKAMGMGGANTAYPQDAFIIASNPAGIVDLCDRVDISADSGYKSQGFNFTGANTSTGLLPNHGSNSNRWSVSGSFAISQRVSDAGAIGLAVYGMGDNVQYSVGLQPDSLPLRHEEQTLFVVPTIAASLTNYLGVGFSFVYAAQRIKIDGYRDFLTDLSVAPNHISNNGFDTTQGVGFRVGALVDILPCLAFAATYATKVYMEHHHKYDGYLADRGHYDLPSFYSFGGKWRIFDCLTAAFDYTDILYNQIRALGNKPAPPVEPVIPPPYYGLSRGPGFGWKDLQVYKMGLEYVATCDLLVRAGYAYNCHVFRKWNNIGNLATPYVSRHNVTTGLTYNLTDRVEFDLAFLYVFFRDMKYDYISADDNTFALAKSFGTVDLRFKYAYQFKANLGWNF